ncbi:hypothetical protein EJD97_004564 [Solanum chilense]|uniref:Tf2-1-like SH3-like domain-containing protein n=1 Tax=Solanum chilense TaxID=4083 RepID=A0A6N2BSZ3_SOLCI|nr:hypothetical protein EJD97_004564 [Solanum chilense]
MRQWGWLDLLKDYEVTILYHPRKANVVADALSRKTPSMESLASLSIEERPLARDVQMLANSLVKYEHQRPACMSQRMPKWERSTVDFVMGSPNTVGGYDSIWVIVDRLTKSAHFISSRFTIYFSLLEGITTWSGYSVRYECNFYPQTDGQSERTIQGDHVWVRESPMKGVMRFGKKGKLSPRFIGPFEISRRYISDESYILSLDSVELGTDLSYEEEPITILDRQVLKLRTKEIASVNVQREYRSVGVATWETESDMRARYPQLFEASGTSFTLSSRMNMIFSSG